MEEFFEDIAKGITTKEESDILLEEIDMLERIIFKNTGTPLSERAGKNIGGNFMAYLKKLEKERLFPDSPNQQLSFFEKIKKYILEIPQIKLELAFEPSRYFLLKIKGWLKENARKDVIFDLTVNPRIAGGAVIECQGQYRNFSLAKKIDELISLKESQ